MYTKNDNKQDAYEPHIKTSKFNSIGTTTVITDWKTGRGVHCLSQGEALWFYILRWDDNNVDMREQVSLDMKKFNKILDELKVSRIRNSKFVMSTDFLVTRNDGSKIAYSVKNDRNLDERTLQLLCAEKMYWLAEGIDFKMLFKEDVNKVLTDNIRLIVESYNPKSVVEEYIRTEQPKIIKRLQIIDNNNVIIEEKSFSFTFAENFDD